MDRLRRMEIFVAVVEAGKFSQAADRLGLTKSAVSHAITALEAYLGVKLLQRSSRGVTMTRDAQNFYESCKRILGDVNDLEDATRLSTDAMSGHIKIAAPTTFGLTHLTPIISEFTIAYPNINISLDLTEHIVDLVEAQIDLAVRVSPIETMTSQMQFLRDHEMSLYASPDFITKHNPIRTLERLKETPCLIYTGMAAWPLQTTLQEIIQFKPRSFIETKSGQAIFELTAQGAGVSYLPDFVAQPGLGDGRIIPFELEGFMPFKLTSFIIYPNGKQQPLRVRKFANLLVERLHSDKH